MKTMILDDTPAIDPAPARAAYKQLQEWSRRRRNQVARIGKRKPGESFKFRSGGTYMTLSSGALVRID